MGKLKTSIEEIKKGIEIIKKSKNIFKTLGENPKLILIFRLNTGLSQTELENKLNMSKNIYKYEIGKIKKMRKKTIEKYLSVLNTNLNSKKIIKNYHNSLSESKGWFKPNNYTKKAMEARRKSAIIGNKNKKGTKQENNLANILKKNNVKYKQEYPLLKNTIVDFFIPNKNIIIECKQIQTHNRQFFRKRLKELAYQGYKIKFHKKNLFLIAFIESKLKIQKIDVEELNGPFDKIFTDYNKFLIFLTKV
jgi:very-short-patch-repair endonuclease